MQEDHYDLIGNPAIKKALLEDREKPKPIKDQPGDRPALKEDEFYYSEAYASIQGEGSSAGKLSWFLRLVGCPVQCAWCDTKFTWEKGYESLVTSTKAMLDQFNKSGAHQIVVTGGEPLLYDKNRAFLNLLSSIKQMGLRIEVETSGFKPASEEMTKLVTCWNVSPKLENAIVPNQKWLDSVGFYAKLDRDLDEQMQELHPYEGVEDALIDVCPRAIFKFVVTPETMVRDFDQIDDLQDRFAIPSERIFIMPEGNKFDRQIESARAVIDEVIKRHYSFSLRQHVIIWDSKRGV